MSSLAGVSSDAGCLQGACGAREVSSLPPEWIQPGRGTPYGSHGGEYGRTSGGEKSFRVFFSESCFT